MLFYRFSQTKIKKKAKQKIVRFLGGRKFYKLSYSYT